MSLDLRFDDAQQAVADAIAQFCRECCPDEALKAGTGSFPAEPWRRLADLGVLALLTPDGDGGALELAAALEALGRAVFPGPLPATFFATQVLPEQERLAVARGQAVVAVGTPPLVPWAPAAQVFIEVLGARAWLARPRGEIRPVDTLGGEPWGRVALEREAELEGVERGLVLYDATLAVYLAAAGRRLVDDTAEHARTRKQFGRALGEFQAVAHPLADCAIGLDGAAALARAAAWELDAGLTASRATAACARLAATRAAVHAAHTCHQLFGAIGITLEGPVFHVSRRILQLAGQPPGDAQAREAALGAFGL